MKRTILVGGLAAAALVAGAALVLAPRADAAGRARLVLAPGDMDVAVTSIGKDAASFYLPYTLTNPMDEARTPRLRFEVRTETGKTTGESYDAKVTAAAERALGKKGLKSTTALRDQELAAGASVEALANFGPIDPNADDISVRVYGLWDPIVRTKQGKVLRETRVLVLDFARRGDEYGRPEDPITLESQKEEIEGEVVELYTITEPKK
jgi:hypothetical protein